MLSDLWYNFAVYDNSVGVKGNQKIITHGRIKYVHNTDLNKAIDQ